MRTRHAALFAGASLCFVATARPNVAQSSAPLQGQRCVSSSTTIDSSFAERSAGTELAKQDTHGPFKLASMRRVEEGYLVSLVTAKEPPPLGGGGLLWVDAETGCVVVLRLYE